MRAPPPGLIRQRLAAMRPTTLASQHLPSGPFRVLSGTKLALHAGMGALRYKTHPAHTPVHPNRYKTRPAHTLACSNRYKTRHTPQKSPILAHFRRAGRKLSRFSQSQPQQGEFSLVVSVSDQSKATCGALPAAGFSHGARPPHGDHLFCPRKAHTDTHTACISTMSHGEWDAAKEISPLLGLRLSA